jgi:hypothetical protein
MSDTNCYAFSKKGNMWQSKVIKAELEKLNFSQNHRICKKDALNHPKSSKCTTQTLKKGSISCVDKSLKSYQWSFQNTSSNSSD